ncbi:TrkA C-terminal domain-containing protein [Rubritalea spongiae]|uniref:TrkA C-terminal domain-containing protein n=1 Tax=Rubritalea spongiae TaxID=430797 RepID=A0ABW5E4M2_9BACT
MTSLFVLILIVVLSLVVVRIGTNALILTGMTDATAMFQAASAFFGVGYTSSEAELVMKHPVRRRVVLHLIIAGNVGITTALATLIVTFVQIDSSQYSNWLQFLIIVSGVLGVAFVANFKPIKKPVDAIIMKSLKSAGLVKSVGYELLLKVQDGYSVSEVMIYSEHPWCGKSLVDSRPSDAGVVILNVRHKNGGFTGAPDKDFTIKEGDELMIYGADPDVMRVARNMEMGNEAGAAINFEV